jgi:hypothetical protein
LQAVAAAAVRWAAAAALEAIEQQLVFRLLVEHLTP